MLNVLTAATLALGLQASTSDAFSLRYASRAVTAVPKFSVGATWQIILRKALRIPPNNPPIKPDFVDVWDIDLFDNTNNGQDSSKITYLKNLPNKPKVICYFSAGSYEVWRTDYPAGFDNDHYGNPLEGWEGEYWFDINSTAVQEVIFNRIRLAARMGCDAVDPDNVDGYAEAPVNKGNRTGTEFTITEEKAVAFVKNMAKVAHENNMAIGLKNALEILDRVKGDVDFAVNEQCVQHTECSSYEDFIGTKPVFHIEYPNGEDRPSDRTPVTDSTKWCRSYKEDDETIDITKFSTVLSNLDLDGWVQMCDLKQYITETA